MKEMFNVDYDNKGGVSDFNELEEEMNQQAGKSLLVEHDFTQPSLSLLFD